MIQTQAQVVDIQHSANKQVAHITFAPLDIFSFHAGQFAFIEIPGQKDIDNKALKKAYSIGSTNAQLQTDRTFTTIVKKTRDGGMSDYLTQKLHIGETVTCTAPLGHLAKESRHQTYLLISTGSGITPIYSIYQTLVASGQYDKIAHIYGERHQDFLIDSISSSRQDSEHIKHFLYLSQDQKNGRQKGHIQASIDKALQFLDTKNIQVYSCGKPSMVEDIAKIL